ncbi:MAG TPA: RNA ligase family protein [Candidatus Dormibacteraeota bacterium]|jgi:hypothetical protein|nr:RNA ligase family protein [Candidatus Dormibacteraeota bacterium]
MGATPAFPFTPWPKIPRLRRGCVITEKIDGTNASIYIPEDDADSAPGVYAGSRTRWLTPESDNFGFAAWVREHEDELTLLGPGHHFGEWWGRGIQRNYGLESRRFSLFNTGRWLDEGGNRHPYMPDCVGVVPVLYAGPFDDAAVESTLWRLQRLGSEAAPGFMRPEGVVVYHSAGHNLYKVLLENDAEPKGIAA